MWFISSLRVISRAPCLFVRTQEELRVREEDQQTITVEVELKRHDSEPTISVPQPPPEARYADSTREHFLSHKMSLFHVETQIQQ